MSNPPYSRTHLKDAGGQVIARWLYFRIQLRDAGGQVIATWSYDEMFPVIPPRFTYPNEDRQAPYVIEFLDATVYTHTLPANIDLNLAIDDAIRYHVNQKLQEH